MIYFQIMLVLLSSFFILGKSSKTIRTIAFGCSILIFIYILSQRSLLVPDTKEYIDIFLYPENYSGFYESGYLYLCALSNSYNFRVFLILISSISLLLWFISSRRVFNDYMLIIPFTAFISFYGTFYFGIILRASLAVLIVYLGLSRDLGKWQQISYYIICCFIATLFHETTILFVVFFFFFKKKYKSTFLYSILIVALILKLLNIIPASLSFLISVADFIGFRRMSSYLLRSSVSEMVISLTFIKHALFSLFFIYSREHIDFKTSKQKMFYNLFLNIYIIGTTLSLLLDFIPAGGRLSMLLLYFEFIPVSFIALSWRQSSFIKSFVFFMLCIVNIITLYIQVPNLFYYTV